MTLNERKNQVKSFLGKTVCIKIDRPIGYVHKKENYSLTYPINYGFIPNIIGGDGEELDVYLMGVTKPVTEYIAKIIGIVHRHNDVEDKLIAAPESCIFYQNEIAEAINFQEKYYETHIEALYQKSSGAVVYTVTDEKISYLLIKQENGDIGFPKGHIEMCETEREAALREIFEETSVKAEIVGDFRQEVSYIMPNGKTKTAIYFAASFTDQTPKHNDGFENNEYLLLEFDDALNILTFDNMKEILTSANKFIKSNFKTHNMNLWDSSFAKMKNGSKTIELRLFDEKRRKISVGDIINFKNTKTYDVIYAEVKALHIFKNFEELYNALPLDKCGYVNDSIASPNDMLDYYTEEYIEKFGVVGIEIKLL